MARKDKARGRAGRLEALLAAGDHGGARAEARALLADPEASGEEREAAAHLLASLRPEPAALACAAVSVALAVALAAWTLTRG
jgi:DNA-binding LacI/PurR family transcriptional regulator